VLQWGTETAGHKKKGGYYDGMSQYFLSNPLQYVTIYLVMHADTSERCSKGIQRWPGHE
jgi:hypothetical protein